MIFSFHIYKNRGQSKNSGKMQQHSCTKIFKQTQLLCFVLYFCSFYDLIYLSRFSGDTFDFIFAQHPNVIWITQDCCNRPFDSSQKVIKLLHEDEAKVDLAQLEKLK